MPRFITIIVLSCLLLTGLGTVQAHTVTGKKGNGVTTAHPHVVQEILVADAAEEVDELDPTCPAGTLIPWTNSVAQDVMSDVVPCAETIELRTPTDDVYLTVRRLLI